MTPTYTQEEFTACMRQMGESVRGQVLPGMTTIVILLCEEDDGSITHSLLSNIRVSNIPKVLRLCAADLEKRIANSISTPLEEEANG